MCQWATALKYDPEMHPDVPTFINEVHLDVPRRHFLLAGSVGQIPSQGESAAERSAAAGGSEALDDRGEVAGVVVEENLDVCLPP